MPGPLAALIASGVITGGGILGSLLTNPENVSPESLTPDLSGLEDLSAIFADPNFGREELIQLVLSGVGSPVDFLGVVDALGGSRAQATEQFEAARSAGIAQALQAHSGLRLGALGQSAALQQLIAQIRQQAQIQAAGINAGVAQNTQNIFKDIASGGAGGLGFLLGRGGGPNNRGGVFGGQQPLAQLPAGFAGPPQLNFDPAQGGFTFNYVGG